MAQVVVLH